MKRKKRLVWHGKYKLLLYFILIILLKYNNNHVLFRLVDKKNLSWITETLKKTKQDPTKYFIK